MSHIKCSRLFGILEVCVFKYSRETDTMKEIENFVLQATIEHFQCFNFLEVEDLTIVDVSTVVITRKFLVELTELQLWSASPFISLTEVFNSSEILFASSFLSPEKMQILWEL